MSKQSDLLVTQLTDSLSGNPETQLATRHLLTESLAAAEPEAIEQEIHKLQNLPQGKLQGSLRRCRTPLFLTLNFLILLTLIIPSTLRFDSLKGMFAGGGGLYVGIDDQIEDDKSDLTQAEKLFIFGDSNRESDKFLPHYQNNPEDPAALAQYLLDSKKATPEYFRLAKTLDPQNSFFPLLEAERTLDKAIARNPAYRGKRSTPGLPKKIISDPLQFEDGMNKLREAILLPDYDNYSTTNQNLKLATYPPETDLPSRMSRLVIKAGRIEDSSLVNFGNSIQLQAVEAQKNGETQKLTELFQLSIAISQRYSQQPSSLIQMLINVGFWQVISETFSKPDFKKHLTIPQQLHWKPSLRKSKRTRKCEKLNPEWPFLKRSISAPVLSPI